VKTELAESQRQVELLTNQRPATVQAQAPVRDWDNETDEQYSFRQMQVVMGHQEQVNRATQDQASRVTHAKANLDSERVTLEAYNSEVDKLNFKGYEDIESRVLDAFPKGSLAHMSKMNPSMTAKIIWNLGHDQSRLDVFANLAHTNASGFNYEFGKMETSIKELESTARRNHKKVSKATGDRALAGSSNVGGSIESKMEAAANSGNRKLYKELKAQRNK
jgi:hypothetical protein